ncbi:MAG: hypothetical protein WKG07_49170 [Hymenobacter sp.]
MLHKASAKKKAAGPARPCRQRRRWRARPGKQYLARTLASVPRQIFCKYDPPVGGPAKPPTPLRCGGYSGRSPVPWAGPSSFSAPLNATSELSHEVGNAFNLLYEKPLGWLRQLIVLLPNLLVAAILLVITFVVAAAGAANWCTG